jgi:hypothetical protein
VEQYELKTTLSAGYLVGEAFVLGLGVERLPRARTAACPLGWRVECQAHNVGGVVVAVKPKDPPAGLIGGDIPTPYVLGDLVHVELHDSPVSNFVDVLVQVLD